MSGQTGRRLVGKISTPAAPKVEPVAPPNECFQNVFAEATTAVTDKLFIVTCPSSRQKKHTIASTNGVPRDIVRTRKL